MNEEQIYNFISETRLFLRDFKVGEPLDDSSNELKVVAPKKGFFSFLYKGWKTIDELSNIGGIITGSKAIELYRFNGQKLISRNTDDWDIILSRDNFLKFCGENNLSKFYYNKDRISIDIKRGIYLGTDGYGDEDYIFKHDIDIIGKDNLPSYEIIGKYKIASLESIISEKLSLIEDNIKDKVISGKHIEDCNLIISKINAYKK